MRLTRATRSEVLDTLRRHIAESGADRAEFHVAVYEHASVETDFCVQVEATTADGATEHDLALHLAAGLQTIGIVQHTRWLSTRHRRIQ